MTEYNLQELIINIVIALELSAGILIQMLKNTDHMHSKIDFILLIKMKKK